MSGRMKNVMRSMPSAFWAGLTDVSSLTIGNISPTLGRYNAWIAGLGTETDDLQAVKEDMEKTIAKQIEENSNHGESKRTCSN